MLDGVRIRHLNCATLCPASARLINGTGGLLATGRMVCHCLLIESNDGLILVDTGLGLQDVADPAGRLGRPFLSAVRPRLDAEETAVRQIERLGFSATDVRHIVMTHLDLDHAGGLADFPEATVHVFAGEHEAAMARATLVEQRRYVPGQWAHHPKWRLHSIGGDHWMGFESVRAVEANIGVDILLVPLIGHTRGHCGVAVRTETGWLLHCGDAYFFHDEIKYPPHCSPGLRVFQRLVAMDNDERVRNQLRLRALNRVAGHRIQLFCAHDEVELAGMQAVATTAALASAVG